MYKYLNEIGKAHLAIAEPMIKQGRVKSSRLKLKTRLIKYYRRAKGRNDCQTTMLKGEK